jgi:hypothetical protein
MTYWRKKMENNEMISLGEAAAEAKVTRQAIYAAMKYRGLKAEKHRGRWFLSRQDLYDYRANKYNRDMRKKDGEYVFDAEKGLFSVPQVQKVISDAIGKPYPAQHLYYLLRTGKLKGFRKGAAWIIEKIDAIELLENTMAKEGLKKRSA